MTTTPNCIVTAVPKIQNEKNSSVSVETILETKPFFPLLPLFGEIESNRFDGCRRKVSYGVEGLETSFVRESRFLRREGAVTVRFARGRDVNAIAA